MKPIDEKIRHFSYELGNSWVAVAGREDWDNEQISLRLAAANDYWFHAKAVSGSHVILHNLETPGCEAPKTVLEQAAAIALYYSKARNAGKAAVSCTLAKHVGKPKGSKVGTVSIRKEKTLKVRPELP